MIRVLHHGRQQDRVGLCRDSEISRMVQPKPHGSPFESRTAVTAISTQKDATPLLTSNTRSSQRPVAVAILSVLVSRPSATLLPLPERLFHPVLRDWALNIWFYRPLVLWIVSHD